MESVTASPALKTSFLFLFLLDLAKGCRAKVWYRTRKHPCSVDSPDSQLHELWCRCSSLLHPCVNFLSLVVFPYCLPLTVTYTKHNGKITISFSLITFYLGSTQSLFYTVQGCVRPSPLPGPGSYMQPILSLFKAVFHKYFPLKWLMEFLFILISHLLSINEKQFLNQAFFLA